MSREVVCQSKDQSYPTKTKRHQISVSELLSICLVFLENISLRPKQLSCGEPYTYSNTISMQLIYSISLGVCEKHRRSRHVHRQQGTSILPPSSFDPSTSTLFDSNDSKHAVKCLHCSWSEVNVSQLLTPISMRFQVVLHAVYEPFLDLVLRTFSFEQFSKSCLFTIVNPGINPCEPILVDLINLII